MLLVFETMNDKELEKLTELYAEGCYKNAKYLHPNDEDLTEAILEQKRGHVAFFKEFLTKKGNTYYVLEEAGQWVSTLRMTKVNDFYYLEALETPVEYRKKGYGSKIIMEVISYLKQDGPVIIRDSVKKDNLASLATHRKCGFVIEHENAIYYLDNNRVDMDHYGLIYKEK